MIKSKTILIVINNTFDERAFLESELIDYLKLNFKKIIITRTKSDEKRDQQFVEKYQKDNVVTSVFVEPRATLYQKFIFKLLKYSVHASTSRIILMDSLFKINGRPWITFRWFFLPVLFISWYLGQFSFWRSFLRMLYKLVKPDRYYFNLLEKYKPDVVFAKYAALGVSNFNTLLFKTARAKKIKTIGNVFSWDNLYSKIFLVHKTDYLAVGTNIVKERALEIGQFKENEIAAVGLSQFDFYFQKDFFKTRDEFFNSIGFDLNKPMILFAIGTNNSERYIKSEHFLDVLLADEKLKNHQIYVRNYPKAHFNQHFMDKYENNKRIVLDQQPSYGKGSFDFKPNDRRNLFNMIFHCELVITFYSTFILEAFIFDKPVVNINYSGGLERGYFRDIKRLEKYTHIQQILRHRPLALVNSDQELVEAISRYLNNPLLDNVGRKKVFDQQIIFQDGQSAKRLANFVYEKSNLLN